jgi:hypothetical protein
MSFGRRKIRRSRPEIERSSAAAAGRAALELERAADREVDRALGAGRASNRLAPPDRIEPLEARQLLSAVISIEPVEPKAREGSEYQASLFKISNTGDEGAFVTWTVLGGTASVGSDLVQHPITLGGESHTIFVPAGGEQFASPTTLNDYYPEPTESFSIMLSVPEGQGVEVVLTGDTANGEIEDDDVKFHSEQKTVTAGDEIEWGVWATDYDGNPVANVAVYVLSNEGPVATVLAHDVTDITGYAELGLRGLGLGAGYITVQAYDDFRINPRSAPDSFRNKSAAPRINWLPQRLNTDNELIASFDGLVRVGIELQKHDGSGPLRKAGLGIEWGMDHTGEYAERQADLGPFDRMTDNFGRAYAYVDGNVVQRLFRDMDPTPTGSTQMWAKFPLTSTFKRVNVRSKAPTIDLRVANTTLQAGGAGGGDTSNLEAYVSTSQGLPVMGSRIVVTTLESDDSQLGFLYNSGGGGAWANTCYSAYSGSDGIATFEARVGTFASPGVGGTAQLVAQCAADIYYSWRNADVETVRIV